MGRSCVACGAGLPASVDATRRYCGGRCRMAALRRRRLQAELADPMRSFRRDWIRERLATRGGGKPPAPAPGQCLGAGGGSGGMYSGWPLRCVRSMTPAR